MVRAIADAVMKRFDDFLEAEVLDTGKPYSVASHVDIPRGSSNFAAFADVIGSTPPRPSRWTLPMVQAQSTTVSAGRAASSASSRRGTCLCCS